MDNFTLMKNKLIESIDKSARMPQKDINLKNTLKTIIKRRPTIEFGNGNDIYRKKFIYDIPREYDNLAQLFIKCTLSTGDVATTPETLFATKIFETIVLRTKNGTTLQTITPRYTNGRVSETTGTPLYNYLQESIDPSGAAPFAQTEVVYVPLFFFFSEKITTFLNTRNLEQLELECTVAANKENMGMTVALTSATFELYLKYFDVDSSNKFSDQILTKKTGIPKQLYGSFDIFREQNVINSSTSTSASLLLRCPHPAYVMHLSLVNQNSDRKTINNVKIKFGASEFLDIDRKMNYDLFEIKHGTLDTEVLSIWFSKMKDRTVDSGLLLMSGSTFPAYLEVEFDPNDPPDITEYTLYTMFETRTNFSVNDKGTVYLSQDYSELEQANSDGATGVNLLG
jgi:hypothetical protein